MSSISVIYNIYKIKGRTSHSCLTPGQAGLHIDDFLITTRKVNGIIEYKQIKINVTTGSQFILRIALSNEGRCHNGIKSGSRYKSYSSSDIEKIIEERIGINVQDLEVKFLYKPDSVHNKNIHNAFHVSGKILKINDSEKLKKVLNEGIGSKKSYGFGQIVFMSQDKNIVETIEKN